MDQLIDRPINETVDDILDAVTMDEIDEEIAATRREMKAERDARP